MTVSQDSFREALLDATQKVPEGLLDKSGAPAGARFSVYRNNVIVSLSEALATAFPLVRQLLGAETFGRLAALFVRAHPPASPLMMFYGEALPRFLTSFEPLRHIGYLPDCARLDLALRQSYHAADATLFSASALPEGTDPLDLRLKLAPASRIVRSPWPLYDIWRFNTESDAPKPRATAQDVLVTRPEYDPQPHLLPAGGADWLTRLENGLTLGEAAEQTLDAHPDFDLTHVLTLVLSSGALVTCNTKDT